MYYVIKYFLKFLDQFLLSILISINEKEKISVSGIKFRAVK